MSRCTELFVLSTSPMIATAQRWMGWEPSPDMDAVMEVVDSDKNGFVEWPEFASWFEAHPVPEPLREKLYVVHYQSAATGRQEETTMDQLTTLLNEGAISEDTDVWVEGMEEWQPLKEVGAISGVQSGAAAKIKEALAAAAGSEAEQSALLRGVWSRADKDGNGKLDAEELLSVLLQMGHKREDVDIEYTMSEILRKAGQDPSAEDPASPGVRSSTVSFEAFSAWFFQQGTEQQESLMVVHYESEGEQVATDLRSLTQLLLDGTVDAETKVWMDGIKDWMPLAEAQQLTGEGDGPAAAAKLRSCINDAPEELQRLVLRRVWEKMSEGSGAVDDEELTAVLCSMGRVKEEVVRDIDTIMSVPTPDQPHLKGPLCPC